MIIGYRPGDGTYLPHWSVRTLPDLTQTTRPVLDRTSLPLDGEALTAEQEEMLAVLARDAQLRGGVLTDRQPASRLRGWANWHPAAGTICPGHQLAPVAVQVCSAGDQRASAPELPFDQERACAIDKRHRRQPWNRRTGYGVLTGSDAEPGTFSAGGTAARKGRS
ncbi:hypothetical protein ACEZDB_12040 [Streptacidiphilus sp. N1-3]|uniref:Uncharacterized protein n=1 Tax=Streptacidiphilus alkalitolerans TaxID=3342712 RepID=A0ABV6WZA8_9ACTN